MVDGKAFPICTSRVLNDPACRLAMRDIPFGTFVPGVARVIGGDADDCFSRIGDIPPRVFKGVVGMVCIFEEETAGGGDRYSLKWGNTASRCGAMVCHELDISAIEPYNMSKRLLEYRASSNPASTFSCKWSTPTTLPNTATLSLQLSKTPRHTEGGGVPRRERESKRSNALMRWAM